MRQTTAFDRKNNPAAILRVMPVYSGQPTPVAVFIRYHDSSFWQQYSREYLYRKCAVNYARVQEIQHFAYYFPENSVFDH